mmetsp:Transcript_64050/g.113941  ORF Transcript_64050/g.113941 Transcript_64050/m.113941 type:complete len:107 (+) Transcript_64050:1240-1560(+)
MPQQGGRMSPAFAVALPSKDASYAKLLQMSCRQDICGFSQGFPGLARLQPSFECSQNPTVVAQLLVLMQALLDPRSRPSRPCYDRELFIWSPRHEQVAECQVPGSA